MWVLQKDCLEVKKNMQETGYHVQGHRSQTTLMPHGGAQKGRLSLLVLRLWQFWGHCFMQAKEVEAAHEKGAHAGEAGCACACGQGAASRGSRGTLVQGSGLGKRAGTDTPCRRFLRLTPRLFQNEVLNRQIQKEIWRIQDVMEGLRKNNPSRGTDTAKHRGGSRLGLEHL